MKANLLDQSKADAFADRMLFISSIRIRQFFNILEPYYLVQEVNPSKFANSIVNDDLNMPRALAAVQELLKSNIGDDQKYTTILDFDRILGLDLDQVNKPQELPAEVKKLVDARQKAREDKEWEASDRLRDEIQALDYMVHDTPDGMKVIKT